MVVERAAGSRTAHASAAARGGMRRDAPSFGRAVRLQGANLLRHPRGEFDIFKLAPFRNSRLAGGAQIGIGQAFPLCLFESLRLHNHALTLVAAARTAKANDLYRSVYSVRQALRALVTPETIPACRR
jgi:hypothetical protein